MKSILFGLLFVLTGVNAFPSAFAQSDLDIEGGSLKIKVEEQQRRAQAWSFNMDNDLFFPTSDDRDYTGGINLRVEGDHIEDYRISLATPLAAINRWLVPDTGVLGTPTVNSAEFGVYGFTPDDTATSEAQLEDRPYASMVYYSNSTTHIDWAGNKTWESTLTVGVLGLGAFEYLQNEVHGGTGGEQTRGWKHQVSDGGEPTLRYDLARQQLINTGHSGLEVKTSQQVSVGYITEASMSLNVRFGQFSTPWWTFKPDAATYGEKAGRYGITRKGVKTQFFWAGVSVKARAYNAFVQGQFRDSEVTFDSDEVNHVLVETWVGYTQAFGNGYSLSYQLRAQTSELRRGEGDRNMVWGGLQVGKVL